MKRDTEEFIELLTGAQSAVFGYILTLCHDPRKVAGHSSRDESDPLAKGGSL